MKNKLTTYLGAVFLLCSFQQQVAAFTQPNVITDENRPNSAWLNHSPSLPPLGPAFIYLPGEEYASSIRLIIRLGDRRVYVYDGEELKDSYPIAIGKQGWETPAGNYEVLNMKEEPAWEHPWTGEVVPPGPDNPLGLRWIGFWTDGRNFIGFHGTPDEETVGEAASHGCIRMLNDDVLALYSQVEVGTPVIVEP